MSQAEDSSPELDELIGVMAEAASAFIGGHMRRYFELMDHTDDYTLMPPTGGDTIHGQEVTDEVISDMEQFFKSGEAELDVIHSYVSGDLAVLVAIERQHGEVGEYPAQDWSLRVTLVFRRDGSRWRLAHRHADALVHPISFDQLAAMARG